MRQNKRKETENRTKNKEKMKKEMETFGHSKKYAYLCIAFENEGRLAQLVQSVCLTSRGSGVRIPQRPHKQNYP